MIDIKQMKNQKKDEEMVLKRQWTTEDTAFRRVKDVHDEGWNEVFEKGRVVEIQA